MFDPICKKRMLSSRRREDLVIEENLTDSEYASIYIKPVVVKEEFNFL